MSAAQIGFMPSTSSGGGGGSTVQAGNDAIATNATGKATVFGTAFASNPSVVANLVSPDGTTILANLTAISTTGFTCSWDFAIPAGWTLSWQATLKTQ